MCRCRRVVVSAVARRVETSALERQKSVLFGDPLLERAARVIRLTAMHMPNLPAAIGRMRTLRAEGEQIATWRSVSKHFLKRLL